jgi:glycerol-3-phosphate dehydrogenase (NAD(P)+)
MSARIKPFLKPGAVLVSAAKGFEPVGLRRLSEVIAENAPGCEVVAFLGPGYAEEVALSMPTAYVAACRNEEAAKHVQAAYASDVFRVYTQSDVIGAEVGTALKNVIALASGILDGMGYGDNSRAALITRGLSEISRLGEAMGGDRLTFSGLTGMGDLVLTCTSMRSRNRRCGILLGKGVPLDEALKEVRSVVEGVANAKPALALGEKYGVELPIVREINEFLYNGKKVSQTVMDLMGREKKMEELK